MVFSNDVMSTKKTGIQISAIWIINIKASIIYVMANKLYNLSP